MQQINVKKLLKVSIVILRAISDSHGSLTMSKVVIQTIFKYCEAVQILIPETIGGEAHEQSMDMGMC